MMHTEKHFRTDLEMMVDIACHLINTNLTTSRIVEQTTNIFTQLKQVANDINTPKPVSEDLLVESCDYDINDLRSFNGVFNDIEKLISAKVISIDSNIISFSCDWNDYIIGVFDQVTRKLFFIRKENGKFYADAMNFKYMGSIESNGRFELVHDCIRSLKLMRGSSK